VWAALREEIAALPPAVRDPLEAAVAAGRVQVDVIPAGLDVVEVTVRLDGEPVFVDQLSGGEDES
jgi:hypothetical protein